MGQHDKRPDGVDTYRTNDQDLDSYKKAEIALSQLQVPVLLHASNPHERLYIAGMDGTGNSMFKDDPEKWSVVARIHKQIESLDHPKIAAGYVEGTFTQNNWLKRDWDGLTGYTFERRVETAYKQFIDQSKEWLAKDPQAQIRLVGVGFSRGGEEIASLQRLIHQRGIQDPDGATYSYDEDDLVTSVAYSKPPLVSPGQTLQGALLFDPVDTGVAEHDRRLPPSVVVGFQITAKYERRDQFPASDVIQPGFSEGHRFLNFGVSASHGGVGNIYALNAIGIRNSNLGVDYLNAYSDMPFLTKQAVPQDPELSVIHRSDQHMHGLYTTFGFRDGVRNHDRILVTRALCRRDPSQDCWNKDPIDPALEATLERRGVPIGPLPSRESRPGPDITPPMATPFQPKPGNDTGSMIDRLYKASQDGSDANWKRESHAVSRDFLGSRAGQAWQSESRSFGQAQQLREQQALEQQALEQQPAPQQAHAMPVPAPTPHAMRM